MAHPTTVDHLALGDHVCWTFDHEDERLDAVARFVSAGLRDGQKMLCHTACLGPQALLDALRVRGVDVDEPAAVGQLQVHEAEETYLPGARFDPPRVLDTLTEQISQAWREGYPGVRLVGDMAWAQPADLPYLAQFEAQLNTLFAAGYALGLCQYDRRLFPPMELRLTGTAHPGTTWTDGDPSWIPMLRMQRMADPLGLRLTGEIDISNGDALAGVLSSLLDELRSQSDPQPFVIDAAGLTFADAAAAHLLLTAARAAPAGMLVRGCTPPLARVFDIIGAATVPGLVVLEEAA